MSTYSHCIDSLNDSLQMNDRIAQFRIFPVQKAISVQSLWHYKIKKLELP